MENHAEQVFNEIEVLINRMGNKDEHLKLAYRLSHNLHRYLQQTLFTEIILPLLKYWAKSYSEGYFDARNEYTCTKSAEIIKFLKETDPYL